jgi:hypothetical protein
MRNTFRIIAALLLLTMPLLAQGKKLWVLLQRGEMVEYDPATFAVKQRVKVPAEALKSQAAIAVNRVGQILFAPAPSLPLSDDDIKAPHKFWLWDGHTATTIDEDVKHNAEETGSNQAITEQAPLAYLSADGKHLYWFANRPRKLEREGVDLSTEITWQAWRTDLAGADREELASKKLPECRCKTGTCEDTCPSEVTWAPATGVENFSFVTQFIAGQTGSIYKASTRYQEDAGKWESTELPEPLQRILDTTPDGATVVEAIPDTGCCGWSNQSDDQTLVLKSGKKIAVFDELATYKNPDYDVSFFTPTARLSPDADSIAMTITSTTAANKPIQLSEQGQANPEESERIRKALAELPAVVVKSVEDTPHQFAFVPHASLIGWITDKELLLLEDHLLVTYNVEKKTRRRTTIRIDDASYVFLR